MKSPFETIFFEVQRVLYKLVLVTDPLYHSEKIYNTSNFGIIKGGGVQGNIFGG